MLIYPPEAQINEMPKRGGIPTCLLSIAGYARDKGVDVNFLDAKMNNFDNTRDLGNNTYEYGLSYDEIKTKVLEFAPDFVGVSGKFTNTWLQSLKVLQTIKQADPKIKTLVGGHHASMSLESIKENSLIDHIIVGEGEKAVYDLLSGTETNKVIYGSNIKNLDELNDPAWDLINIKNHNRPDLAHYPNARNHPLMDLLISRGCPRDCSYCTTPKMHGRKIRTFSKERIQQQIQKINSLGYKEIAVEDDEIITMPKDIRDAYFEALRKSRLSWVIDAGVYYPRINEEFVQSLADSNCHQVFVPIENPHIGIMHQQNKYHEFKTQDDVPKQIESFSRLFKKYNIQFYSAIMTGFPEERKTDIDYDVQIGKFIKENGAHSVYFFSLLPLPGTRNAEKYQGHAITSPEKFWLSKSVLNGQDFNTNWLDERLKSAHLEINGMKKTIPGGIVE